MRDLNNLIRVFCGLLRRLGDQYHCDDHPDDAGAGCKPKKFNKGQGKDSRKMHSSMPNDYFKEPVTRIAFTECDRVPYLNGESSSGIDSKFPWERVLYDDLKTPAELNDGAVWFDDDYESTDNRIYMFLQREKGHVKSYGEITGGHTTDTTAYGEMWWNK